MLTPTQKTIIRATVPALQAHGDTITRTFYARLFTAHPELLNIFNPANQQTGQQARSLAASVLAYAEHIDRPDTLEPMIRRIAHKHVSLEVQPEQYAVVGEHLLAAIAEVLGEAATPDILGAWAAAYHDLAALMSGTERRLYRAGAAQDGGWTDFTPLRIVRKTRESSLITSFVLERPGGEPLPTYLAGQYVSVKVNVPGDTHWHIRQYSLTQAPTTRQYRIAVKREPGGAVSTFLHDHTLEGDELLVHVPAGDFTLRPSERPAVLISGGVGVTPLLSMLHTVLTETPERPVMFIHAALNRSVHAFRAEVGALAAQHPQLRTLVFYADAQSAGPDRQHAEQVGLISTDTLRPALPEGADVYFCGPAGFVSTLKGILDELGVPVSRRMTETFGPSQQFARPAEALAEPA
ncbi:NO-inducible flavohemoprotein [Deinococcus radiotolerans]|uniref:nitric oxide dioxygenase n=1 Tax=Deinococcus radiotolerans TaxID=1309407 RepID=A0ABQ2FMY9_9DEIO|nr:NO-inducible flavohemoprotein [Deinococcus radiotolerans]GGL07976.1 flavohemoprotein [Deinococcus radiotolerans]